MEVAEIPQDEEERIAALEKYRVLDTLPEQAYDDITNIAATICNTPIALISLVDKDRQWFKSKVGLDADETPRDIAFCSHAILQSEVFEVPDALEDARFADNPLVTTDPNIRFYAGAPLVTPDGYSIGTLCAIDRKPRQLNKEQLDAMKSLGRQVVAQLELTQAIHNVVSMQDKTLELAGKLKKSNQALEQFAYSVAHDLKAPLRTISNATAWLEEDLDSTLSDENREHMTLLRGRVMRMHDLVEGLLDYARLGINDDDREPEVLTGLELLNQILLLQGLPDTFQVQHSANFDAIRVTNMPLQQVLNNLISNAFKHHDKESGVISLDAKDMGSHYQISVKDDGPGIEERYHEKIFELFHTLKPRDQVEGSGMGLAVILKIVDSCDGSIEVKSEGRGTEFVIRWPKLADQE